ncbi:MAG: pyridoxamine 5'-phosphate oxidase family protein [Pseudomonadota bacterium]|nr:pyridoxamine 5'-phosphate oxidase family protein [Pseudomonadota bacterium]
MQQEKIDLVWVWSKLQAGIKTNKNEYHLMQLSYIDGSQCPKVDTVVLRHLTNRHVYFHTDFRSQKVEALRHSPNICLHWYSREDKVQISIQGNADIHHQDELCRERWGNMKSLSQECYHQVGKPGTEYSSKLATFDLSKKAAFDNFTVIGCEIKKMDVLLLRLGDNVRYIWSEGDDSLKRIIA